MTPHPKQITLVLGSGGARGLAHIGVIKLLEENNVHIDRIVGTSIGALVGGLYASGIEVEMMEEIVREADKLMVAKMFMPRFASGGFVDNKRVRKFITGIIGENKIEKSEIPFAAVATDLITGEEIVIDKGPLVDAIMASSAIPTIFPPVFHQGRYFVDGALSNPLPISVAKKIPGQYIIAVNVASNPEGMRKKIQKKHPAKEKPAIKPAPKWFSRLTKNGSGFSLKDELRSMLGTGKEKADPYSPTLVRVFLQSISISTNNLIAQRIQRSPPDVLISPRIEDVDMLAFYKGSEIIQCGYDAAKKTLQEI